VANGETEIFWRQRFCVAEKFFGASGDMPFGFFLNHEQPICTHARLHARGFTACPIPVTIAQLPKCL
jgi:hypothetical protein